MGEWGKRKDGQAYLKKQTNTNRGSTNESSNHKISHKTKSMKNNMNKNKTYPKQHRHIPKPSNEAPSIPEQNKQYEKYLETQRREQFLKTNSQPPFIHKIQEVVDEKEDDEKEERLAYCDVCGNNVPLSEIVMYVGDMSQSCYNSQQRCQDCNDEINSEDDDDYD